MELSAAEEKILAFERRIRGGHALIEARQQNLDLKESSDEAKTQMREMCRRNGRAGS